MTADTEDENWRVSWRAQRFVASRKKDERSGPRCATGDCRAAAGCQAHEAVGFHHRIQDTRQIGIRTLGSLGRATALGRCSLLSILPILCFLVLAKQHHENV